MDHIVKLVKKFAVIFTIIFVTYFLHRRLQYEYYRMCNTDILTVLFFRNSDYCILMHKMIKLIEMNYIEVFKSYM